LNDLLPQFGIATTFVDPTDPMAFKKAITPQTRVLYTETVANPTLKIADIPALAKIAKSKNLSLVVDNTFTPMVVSPLQLGADVVVYSMTKYINGASDLIAGAICTTKSMVHELMDLHTGRVMLLGPTMDPRMAYDIIQRLPHLALRMREHSRRALAICQRLEQLGAVVTYPGLESFAQHDLAAALFNKGYGYGGMFTIDCKNHEQADAFLDQLQNKEDFGYIAVSLGYFDTLMSCSGVSTSSEISADDQKKMGLSPGLVRLSMGYTGSLEKRIRQMERAVKAVGLVD
jgi:methionine-gamma-lyase